jgi:predicted nucleic acid-binding Zn ribbon protein
VNIARGKPVRADDLADDADNCWQCGKALPDDAYWGIRKFCCRKCNRDYHNGFAKRERHARRHGRTCMHCGGPIPTTRINAAFTCSRACAVQMHVDRDVARQRAANLQAKAGRTCEVCQASIPPEKRADARTCSRECKRKLPRKQAAT